MILLVQLFFLFLFITYFYQNWNEIDRSITLLLLAKIVSAVLFVFIYCNYYKEGDILTYQELADSFLLELKTGKIEWKGFLLKNEGFPSDGPYRPREIFFCKLITVVYGLSFSNLFVTSIVFSIFSWVMLFELYKKFKERNWDEKVMVYAFFLAPSILFFTSGILKEALCFPFFGLFVVFILNWFEKKFVWTELVLSLLGVFLFLNLRYFYIPFLLVFASIYGGMVYAKDWRFWGVLLVTVISYLSCQKFLMPQLQLKYFSELIYQSHLLIQIKSSPGTSFIIDFPDASMVSTLWAMVQSIKFTFFISVLNIPVTLITIENIIILLGLIGVIFTKPKMHRFAIAVLGMALFMIILLNVTTPNYGTLTRYRVTYWYPMAFLIGLKIKDLFNSKRPFES